MASRSSETYISYHSARLSCFQLKSALEEMQAALIVSPQYSDHRMDNLTDEGASISLHLVVIVKFISNDISLQVNSLLLQGNKRHWLSFTYRPRLTASF